MTYVRYDGYLHHMCMNSQFIHTICTAKYP